MEIRHDPINELLREGKIDEANRLLASGTAHSLSNTDFGGLDLSGLNTCELDFSNSRFHLTDLRGLDLSSCNLQGASLMGAKVSGTLFPAHIPAQEIMMSLEYGTRIRG